MKMLIIRTIIVGIITVALWDKLPGLVMGQEASPAPSPTTEPTPIIEISPSPELTISVTITPSVEISPSLTATPSQISGEPSRGAVSATVSPSPSPTQAAEATKAENRPTQSPSNTPHPTEAIEPPIPAEPPKTGGPPAEEVKNIGRQITKPLDYINPVINKKIYGEEALSPVDSYNLTIFGVILICMGIVMMRPKLLVTAESWLGGISLNITQSDLLKSISRLL